jgi:hypothetical protein
MKAAPAIDSATKEALIPERCFSLRLPDPHPRAFREATGQQQLSPTAAGSPIVLRARIPDPETTRIELPGPREIQFRYPHCLVRERGLI